MKIAIIGGGLAGCAAAYVLKTAGHAPVIYEAGETLACGASGNDVGLYNPRISAEFTPEAEYFSAAFQMAAALFPTLQDIDFNGCGALHLVTSEKKAVQFSKTLVNWPWAQEEMRLVSAAEASEIAGVALTHDALYLPQAGAVSPKKLCAAYTRGVEVYLNAPIEGLESLEADAVLIASGAASAHFLPDLPLKTVRGQVSAVKATSLSAQLKCNLCYDGYFPPASGGVHVMGASFQRWLTHTDILPEDDDFNIGKLAAVSVGLAEGLETVGHRAGLRVSAPDYFPIVGWAANGVYVSTAHGSYGIVSSLIAAHEIAAMIAGQDGTLSAAALKCASPKRFLGAD